MEIEISNRIAVRGAPYPLLDDFTNYLTIENPVYSEAVSAGRGVQGISKFLYNFENIYGGIAIPRGCRQRLLRAIKKYDIKKCNIIDKRTKFDHIHIDSSAINYRPYQYGPVLDITTKGDEGLLIAPPGSGKTVIGLSIIPIVGQPTLWLTHTKRLAKQVIERAEMFLPSLQEEDYGFIGANKWSLGNLFTVALIQTLIRREEELDEIKNRFGLVILDEAHHCPAETFIKVVSQLNPYFLYGLTATPYRRDKLEVMMFQTLGEVSAVIKVADVEKHGGIVVPKVIYREVNSRQINDNNVSHIITEYIINNDKRNHLIVGDVVREAKAGNFCIVVSDRKVHCEILYELISIAWPKTGIATGDYSDKCQDEQVEKFYKNEITVLITTFALLGEGFDVDFLNRAFITTPFRAEGKVEQLVGRIQRSAKWKKDAIVYDYVDVNIGVLKNQFHSKKKDSRHNAYKRLGMEVEPYSLPRKM